MYQLQYDVYELLWLALIYSLLGWCAGVAAAAVNRKQFINTGVLNLPFCPAYGVLAVLCSIFMTELKHYPVFLFLDGAIVSAFVLACTGTVLEHIFHRRWKDYSDYRFGFGGHITLQILIAGGLFAIGILWIGNPFLLKLIHLIPQKIGKWILLGLYILVAIDLSGVLAVVWKWRRHINRVSEFRENAQMVSETFGNAITRGITKRLEHSYPNIETKKILASRAKEQPKDTTTFAAGLCFFKLFWLFFLGALLGDFVETIFCRVTMGYWMSRSSLVYGPFSIVWGFACAVLTVFLYRYRNKSDRYIFIYGTVVGGTYEYLCSVLSELLFGYVFWDYSGLPFNLNGRINLLYCFFWGIAAVVWLKGVYPLISGLIERIPKRIGTIVTWILVIFMVLNIALSGAAFGRYSQRQNGVPAANAVEQFLDDHFDDARIEKVYPKAKNVK